MYKPVYIFAAISLGALATPSIFERYKERLAKESVETVEPAPRLHDVAHASGPLPERAAPLGANAVIALDAGGHFRTEARINGRPVDVLIDTGATSVVLTARAARRLSIHPMPNDYRHTAITANGEVPIARVLLDSVEIDGIRVRGVEAVVVDGDGPPTTLIGMSFLSKLRRYEVEAGRLRLTP